jgi:hypothetical protein
MYTAFNASLTFGGDMKLKNVLPILLVAAFLLSACGAQNNQSAIQTGIAQTLQISQLETAAAGAGNGNGQAPQATTDPGQPAATQQPTDTPTITMTWTPSVPYVTVSQDTNCRRGPSISYGLVTTILVGQQVQVLKTFSNSYAVVQNPNGSGDCWLYLQYANTTDFSAYSLVAATQPPTPTNTATATPDFDWDGSWNFQANGSPYNGVNINQSGNSLSGSFMSAGNTISFSLTLSSNHQSASGTWTNSAGPTGTVQWMIKSGNHNQFIGSYVYSGTTYEWCGARPGSSIPSPCQWP